MIACRYACEQLRLDLQHKGITSAIEKPKQEEAFISPVANLRWNKWNEAKKESDRNTGKTDRWRQTDGPSLCGKHSGVASKSAPPLRGFKTGNISTTSVSVSVLLRKLSKSFLYKAGFVHGRIMLQQERTTVDTKLEHCLTWEWPFIWTLWLDFVLLIGSMTPNLLLMFQTGQWWNKVLSLWGTKENRTQKTPKHRTSYYVPILFIVVPKLFSTLSKTRDIAVTTDLTPATAESCKRRRVLLDQNLKQS